MSIGKRLITSVGWMFAGNWAEQIVNFLVFVIIVRITGPEIYGLATMAIVFILFAEFLVRQTITETIIKLKTLEDGHLDAAFWLLGSLSIVLICLLILFSGQIAALYSEPDIATYLVWATPTILIIGFSGIPVTLLKRKLEFRTLAIRATIGVFAGGVVGITMALMDFGVWSFIGQRVVQIFVNNILAWISMPWLPKFRAKGKHFKDIVGFSSQVGGLRITELISINSPLIIIGVFLGPTVLGQFTLAWRLVEVLTFLLITPIQFVAQPAFAHFNRNKERVGELLLKITQTSSLITFASFIGIAAISSPTIILLFGPEWIEASPAHQILCLVGIYLSIERLQQAFLLALGHAKNLFYLSFIEAVVGIIGMIYMADFGTVGIAIAFTARYYLFWPLRLMITSKYAKFSVTEYLKVFMLPLFNALLMGYIVVMCQKFILSDMSTYSIFFGSIFIGLISYCIVSWLTMRRQNKELLATFHALRKENQ